MRLNTNALLHVNEAAVIIEDDLKIKSSIPNCMCLTYKKHQVRSGNGLVTANGNFFTRLHDSI